MKVSGRALFVAAVFGAVAALYSCGGEKTPSLEPENQTGAPAPGGSNTSNAPRPAPPAATGAIAPAPPTPPTCAFLDSPSGAALELDTGCKECVAGKCCSALVACFQGPAPDAGLGFDGGGTGKSACEQFGECERTCFSGIDAGGDFGPCEDACRLKYGDPAANAWIAADSCLYGPSPTGCACP